ncbi:MAG TPA: hypothetical protein VN429_12100 [Methanospirillum sp.]|uniref:hypothetical protein n=1 Tax=Methanospirillum sp. TaxID=45200 RepID=UPI002D1DB491|nr:hypothetical protein [Methanospirillum sp.]HWQ65153.1 hypothetical protein [Methanospirillum sp.]
MENGLSFWFDVPGQISVDLSLASTSQIGVEDVYTPYVGTEDGLTFWFNVPGKIVQDLALSTVSTISLTKNVKLIRNLSINTGSSLSIYKSIKFLKQLEINTVSEIVSTLVMNAGYENIIMFGSLVLSEAQPEAEIEYNFPCKAVRLLDGSQSLHSVANLAFVGNYIFKTYDYNDVQALMNMVGTYQTLRVWGKPYRNCMIWSPIKVRQPKKRFSAFVVTFPVYMDTSLTTITS